jgi:hypothetical protein
VPGCENFRLSLLRLAALCVLALGKNSRSFDTLKRAMGWVFGGIFDTYAGLGSGDVAEAFGTAPTTGKK